ncbi:hypothetical protein CDAR_373611 [Caerostris darwini]|uniref:Uncharacterized protein n=1 Tax=Caerostris darwini TaxID=1538125 RepID=A0AAV4QID6_9ARAC|nr:hypothetical protein CDAR_373611 [Caerostris darwini]
MHKRVCEESIPAAEEQCRYRELDLIIDLSHISDVMQDLDDTQWSCTRSSEVKVSAQILGGKSQNCFEYVAQISSADVLAFLMDRLRKYKTFSAGEFEVNKTTSTDFGCGSGSERNPFICTQFSGKRFQERQLQLPG